MKPTNVLIAGLALMLATASWAAGDRPAATPYPGEPSIGERTETDWDWFPLLASGTGVQAAADFVISEQCDDGGWGWPLHCPPTYYNITAPIAIGLLRAYDLSGDVDTLLAAIEGGEFDLTGVFADTGDTAFGSFTPAFFYILSDVTGDTTYSDNAAVDFFDKLTAGTYGDPAADPTYYPADTYDFLDRHKAKRSGYLVNLRPWDMQYMPWVAGLIGNADSSSGDGVSQQDTFLQAVLDGLNTLDDSDPANVPWDLIGLAGGVRGLAMNGTTSFPAIVAPNHAINGIGNLCDLADALAAYQNSNGSWYWSSNLSSPDSSDEDTQNTLYAVLALVAAQEAGCGSYDTEIDKAREWLWSMQDSSDGGFFSYPGGDKNIEVCGEVISASTPVAEVVLDTDYCNMPGGTLTVELNVEVETGQYVRGGQFFLKYDTAVLTFVSAVPHTDFPQEFEDVKPGEGTIDYSVGVAQGEGGVLEPTNMATLTFDIAPGSDLCETADLVEFRSHVPPSRLGDDVGEPILLTPFDLEPVMIDGSPPDISCADDIDVNADAGLCTAVPFGKCFGDKTFTSVSPNINFSDVYDLTAGDLTLSYTLDMTAGAQTGPNETPYVEIGLREVGADNFNPGLFDTYQGSAGGWMTSLVGDLATDPNNLDLDDKHNLSASGARGEQDYDVRYSDFDLVVGPYGTYSNQAIWFDRDGVDPYQAADPLSIDGAPYNTGGIYEIEIRYHAIDATLGVMFATINGVPQSFDTSVGGLGGEPAGLSFKGDMTQMQVFAGSWFTSGASGEVVAYDICTGQWGPVVTDTCDPTPFVEYWRSGYANWNEGLNDPYPAGTTTITWRATDHCDNYVECEQDVIVSSFNELVVDVQLSPTMVTGPLTRCITFELWDCTTNTSVTVQKTIEFTNGLGSAMLDDVPCGVYNCITARDTLHTLRSTDDGFGIVGTQYVADFTGGDELIGGNLNDDQWIDILDYAIFTWQWGVDYGSGNTNCSTSYPHADINGSGVVDTAEFTFIQINYMKEHEDNCCGMPGYPLMGGPVADSQSDGPVTRISVRELKRRGLGHLAVGDLNGDGWLDEIDMVLFIQGVSP